MMLLPTGSVLVVQLALPPESALVLQPDRLVQVMVPVGVSDADTVTVQVTDWP
jgi:hypothetical protein